MVSRSIYNANYWYYWVFHKFQGGYERIYHATYTITHTLVHIYSDTIIVIVCTHEGYNKKEC